MARLYLILTLAAICPDAFAVTRELVTVVKWRGQMDIDGNMMVMGAGG